MKEGRSLALSSSLEPIRRGIEKEAVGLLWTLNDHRLDGSIGVVLGRWTNEAGEGVGESWTGRTWLIGVGSRELEEAARRSLKKTRPIRVPDSLPLLPIIPAGRILRVPVPVRVGLDGRNMRSGGMLGAGEKLRGWDSFPIRVGRTRSLSSPSEEGG